MIVTLLLWLCYIITVVSGLATRPGTDHLIDAADKFPGSLTLYEFKDFAGYNLIIPIEAADTCYNLKCFDNMVSSAIWDLPADGNFNNDACLAFYTDLNCMGMMHVFNIRDKDRVTDLSNGSKLDNNVSAVMVLRTRTTPLSIVKECANDTKVAVTSMRTR